MLKQIAVRYRSWPLQRKMTALFVLLVQFALLLFALAMALGQISLEVDKRRNASQTQAQILANNAVPHLLLGVHDSALDLLAALRVGEDFQRAMFFDAAGLPFASYATNATVRPWTRLIDASHEAESPLPGNHLVVVQAVQQGQTTIGWVAIERRLDSLWHELALWMAYALVAWAVTLVASLWLARQLSKSVTRPLLRLADLTREVSQRHDYSLRSDIAGKDEVADLARGINQMLERIDERGHALEEELLERTRVQAKLDHLAHYDQLTGLPNRHYFTLRIESAVASAVRFGESRALIFVDLDNFKLVNDTLGHPTGDLLLKEVALRLTHALRAGDVVCRLGGDEFAIILETIANPGDACTAADKLLAALKRPIVLDGTDVPISASIGIAVCPLQGETPEALLRHADLAMYRAKALGKNTYALFSDEMLGPDGADQRLAIAAALQQAIQSGSFELYYQPQVEISSARIVGLEALIRWRDSDGLLVPPGQFLPLAEETGLSVPIGEWTLTAVCRQLASWRSAGVAFPPVAINLSARQFFSVNFAAQLHDLLQAFRLEGQTLEFEIAESLLLQPALPLMSLLGELGEMGIRLTLDNFGTGYSSLVQLKDLPIQTLKIDQSFIADVPQATKDAAIIRAFISVGLDLGLRVIAQGVERLDQLDFLMRCECPLAQGNLFSPPLPAAGVPDFLRRPPRMPGPVRNPA